MFSHCYNNLPIAKIIVGGEHATALPECQWQKIVKGFKKLKKTFKQK